MREFIHECLKRMMILVGIMFVAGLITYLINPNIQDLVGSMDAAVSSSIDKTTEWKQFVSYIRHNGIGVPVQMFVFALIPIPFIYWLQPLATAILPGILFGVFFRYSLSKGIVLGLSALPHTLLELLAYSVLLVVLSQFNRWVRSKVVKKNGNEETFSCVLKKVVVSYVGLVIPLIIVAAFFETYVADWINTAIS